MDRYDEDEVSLWWDIVEDAMHRRDNIKCPCEKKAPIEVESDEHQVVVRCTECGKFVEALQPY